MFPYVDRTLLAGLLLTLSPHALSHAQATNPTGVVGWYNGDRQIGIPGWSNWYVSDQECARVYDDFVVPAGGWTIVGAFSSNTFYNAPAISQAAWEIRSGMSPGSAGTLVAWGVSAATQTADAATSDPMTVGYRIRVDGLQVQLAPGRYWLSVSPVGPRQGQSYVAATLGAHAVGDPPGNNGGALSFSAPSDPNFTAVSSTGSQKTSADFSQGVLISATSAPPPLSPSDQWRADLVSLVQQMQTLHSVPYPGISLADFNAKAADLSARIPMLSDAEIRTGLEELVASIEDPHTDVEWPYPSTFRLLPLSFYWFDDGIYVTGASAQYQNLLGGRLLSVGQTAIDDATQMLTALVPHENDQ